MSYAQPEVLVDTDWVSQNPPNENRKIVEVDYDPENGYKKGHIKDASLIWWKRDINDPITRDIINKKQFEELMSKKWNHKPDTEVILMVILIIGLQHLFFGFSNTMVMKI